MFYLPFVLQLLLTTDVTDMQTVPAAPPTLTGASGAMIRSAFQQAATAAWSVSAGGRLINYDSSVSAWACPTSSYNLH